MASVDVKVIIMIVYVDNSDIIKGDRELSNEHIDQARKALHVLFTSERYLLTVADFFRSQDRVELIFPLVFVICLLGELPLAESGMSGSLSLGVFAVDKQLYREVLHMGESLNKGIGVEFIEDDLEDLWDVIDNTWVQSGLRCSTLREFLLYLILKVI